MRSDIAAAQSVIAERRSQVAASDQRKFQATLELVLGVENVASGTAADSLFLRLGKELGLAADRLEDALGFVDEEVNLRYQKA